MTSIAGRLVADVQQNILADGRAVLVIDGDCAAGKTTLAARVAARLSCNVFHMDDFFLPPAMRTEARLCEAGENVHYERFLEQVLVPLRENTPFSYGAYSCQSDTTRGVSVSPAAVSVIEGSYSLHPRFLKTYREMHAIKVFLRIPEEEQLRRLLARDGEAMLRRFREEWIPMEKRYRQAYETQWDGVQYIDGMNITDL